MKRFLGLTILTLAVTLASHADPVPIPLWPNGAPGEKATSEPEKDMTTAKDGLVAGRSLIRLGNVTAPTITVYPPANPSPSKTAVVVFPGGGYQILALDLEGTEVCRWLNSLGITAVLLKYRVPEPASVARHAEPLQDAQRAVGLVRAHASEWKINPNRIGVLGFSAGGHLAALLSNSFETRTYPPIDNADQVSCQPNFAVLVYPAYLSVKDQGEQLAPEVAVRGHTPPTFIVQAEDDHAFIDGTLLYFRALRRAGVPAEMHIYPSGGHGYGLRTSAARVTAWPKLAGAWLRSLGVLEKH